MEVNNLPDKEFKIMVLKMLIEFRRRMDERSEGFNKETENILKVPNRSHRAEEHTRGIQQETRQCRRKDQ